MAITFRSIASIVGASGSNGVLAAPAGLANDDILVLYLYKETNTAVTWPSGFTQVATVDASDVSFSIYVAWKRAASESGTYTVSWAAPTWRAACLAAYTGCITTGDPNDATPTVLANGSQVNLETCPTITTVSPSAMLIAMAGSIAGPSVTAPSGMALRATVDNCGMADVIQAAAGASGAKSFGCTATAQTAGITMALKPPASGPAQPRNPRTMAAIYRRG